jgi:hypothetical protein
MLERVHNDRGKPFNIRVVLKGERYGREDCLVHDEEDPLVEFYDASFGDVCGPRGQFVSRYYLSTIKEQPDRGILLEGSEPRWTVSAGNVQTAIMFAEYRVETAKDI